MSANLIRTTAMTAALATGLAAGPAFADVTLNILHINDLHSRIQPINRFDSTCNAEDDAAGECFGGVARVATAINMMRAELEGQNVLVSGCRRPVPGQPDVHHLSRHGGVGVHEPDRL